MNIKETIHFSQILERNGRIATYRDKDGKLKDGYIWENLTEYIVIDTTIDTNEVPRI